MTEDRGVPENPPPIPGALLDMLERARYDLVQVLEALIVEVEGSRKSALTARAVYIYFP